MHTQTRITLEDPELSIVVDNRLQEEPFHFTPSAISVNHWGGTGVNYYYAHSIRNQLLGRVEAWRGQDGLKVRHKAHSNTLPDDEYTYLSVEDSGEHPAKVAERIMEQIEMAAWDLAEEGVA